MSKKNFISFITVNYNGYQDTYELIQSIYSKINTVDYEIIVVDNASRENEAALLKQKFPDICAIRSEDNLGFAGGNNLGIKVAKGDFLFFINNDTYFEEDRIYTLIQKLNSKKEIAGISPKIKDAIPPYNIQFAGFTHLSRISLRNKTIGLGDSDIPKYNIASVIPYMHGAGMCVKKEAISKVGLMPEIFFLYYEELDWSEMFTRNGYKLWYEPACTLFHKESQSTGKISTLRIYYITRNRLLFAWRNLKGIEKILSILYQIFIVSTKNIIEFSLNRKFNLINPTIRGINDFIILPDKKGNPSTK